MPYNYDRRAKALPPELVRGLDGFGQYLLLLEKWVAEQIKEPDEGKVWARLTHIYKYLKPYVETFRDILATYQTSAQETKVLQEASLALSKTRVQIRKRDTETMEAFHRKYRGFLETARHVVQHNPLRSTGDWKAGPFNLVNAGGFSDSTMQEAQKATEKASTLMHRKGLGRVCYGDIQVSGTIHKSTRVLAFYLPSQDDLYIRANFKGQLGPAVSSILHELGHRLQHKFLTGKRREIAALFGTLQRKEGDRIRALIADPSNWPATGVTVQEGRKMWVVDRVKPGGRGVVVQLHQKDDPKRTGTMDLASWMLSHGSKDKPSSFVTPYAKKSPEENLCEMLAAYCEDTLPADQVPLLEAILE